MSARDKPPIERIVDALKHNMATYDTRAQDETRERDEALVRLQHAVGDFEFHKRHEIYVDCFRRSELSRDRAWMYREVMNLVCGIARGADVRTTI